MSEHSGKSDPERRIEDMTGEIKRGKKRSLLADTLGLCCLLQIVFLLLYNIIRAEQVVDFDNSAYYILARQIWRQKTLLPADYYYTTQLLWDSPLFLTSLLYGLIGNVFLAAGIANDLLIAVYVWILRRLSGHLHLSVCGRRIVLLAIFTIYQFGYVDYAEEMFVGAAWYGVRIAAMLLLLDVMVCVHSDERGRWRICFVLCLIEFFISGISTGAFTIGCCILPVLLYEICRLASSESCADRKKQCRILLLPVFAAIISGCGIIVNRAAGLMPASTQSMRTVAAADLITNFLNYIAGYFQLMGWPAKGVRLFSINGIAGVACVAVAGLYAVILYRMLRMHLQSCKRSQKSPSYNQEAAEGDAGKDQPQAVYTGMLVWLALVMILLFFCVRLSYTDRGSEYRYWLALVIPPMLSVGMAADSGRQQYGQRLWRVLVMLWMVCMICINAVRDVQLWKVKGAPQNAEEIFAYLKEENADFSYLYMDYFTGRTLSAFAPDDQEAYPTAEDTISDDGRSWIHQKLRMQRWGSYVKYDGDCTDMPAHIRVGVVMNGTYPEQEKFLRARSVSWHRFGKYTVAIFDQNVMDYTYGMPRGDKLHACDVLNWGYTLSGMTLTEDGKFQSDGRKGTVAEGTFTADADGVYAAMLQYQLRSGSAALVLQTEDGRQYISALSQNVSSAELEGVRLKKGEKYTVTVQETDGTDLILDRIDYFQR